MLVNLSLVAAIAAIGAAAVNPAAVRRYITKRQTLSSSDVPSACESDCSQTITFLNGCQNGDENTCLSICTPSVFSSYRSCLQCILANNPDASEINVEDVNEALDDIEQLCDSVGSTVSAAAFSGGASDSGGASASATPTESGGLLPGISASGSASFAPSIVGSAASASVTAAASSSAAAGGVVAGASSSAAAATSSPAAAASSSGSSSGGNLGSTKGGGASVGAQANIFGVLLAVVGVAAGAAVAF